MKWIKLNEKIYRGGSYRSQPITVNLNEISEVKRDDTGYTDNVFVIMRNRNAYSVCESYEKVLEMIVDKDS